MDGLLRKLGFLTVFFALFHVTGQTPGEVRQITKEYDKTKLESLEKKFHQQFQADKEYALKMARLLNIPIVIEERGEFSELMKIMPDGTPVYYTTTNTGAAQGVRTNHLLPGGSLGLNLSGQNMKMYIWDQGTALASHQEYKDAAGNTRYTVGDSSTKLSQHASHVTGTVIATGIVPRSKGMAPEASAEGFDWNFDKAEAVSATLRGMLISNHSYRAGGSYGTYIPASKDWDEIMYNAPYYLAVWAAGNDGSNSSLNPDPIDGATGYDLIRGGGQTAKNSLTVANARNIVLDDDGNLISAQLAANSSPGPMDEYRIKPEIAGNGYSIYSTGMNNSQYYYTTSGTSMASPNVAGTLLLLQQHYNQLNGNFMRAATLKGLAMHTADDAGPVGPDAKWGWGLLNAKKAAEVITLNSETSAPIIQELTLNSGQTYEITVNADGLNKLMASISWTDLPSTKPIIINDPTTKLVNDLDLRIIKGSTVYMPWKLTSVSTNGKGDNSVDPYERVEVDGAYGTYTIRITHKGTLSGGSQKFSLILTGITAEDTGEPENTDLEIITEWELTNTPAHLYTKGNANYVLVKDGVIKSSGTLTGGNTPNTISLPAGSSPGTYIMRIYNTSNFAFVGSRNSGSSGVFPEQMTKLTQWGTADLNSDLGYMFAYSNIEITAGDIPLFKPNTSLKGLFIHATEFDNDLNHWNVSQVYNFSQAFSGATNFNQHLGGWNMTGATDIKNMLDHSGMDCMNYENTLKIWAGQNVNSGLKLGVVGIKYSPTGVVHRHALITKGWTFSGDSLDVNCNPDYAPCYAPDNLTAVPTYDSATITWDQGDASVWKLKLDNTEWITVNTNSYTVTGLSPQTDYTVYVKTVCPDKESVAIAKTFTTDRGPQPIICDKPNDMEINMVSDDSETLTYEVVWDPGNATEWYWYLDNVHAPMEGYTTEPSVILESLQYDTDYVLSASSICGEEDSDFVSIEFRTPSAPNVLIANNDFITTIKNGGILNTESLLANDLHNGSQVQHTNVNISSLNLPSGFMLSPLGTVIIYDSVQAGTYNFTYKICLKEDDGVCSTAQVTMVVEDQPDANCDISLSDNIEFDGECLDADDTFTVTLTINGESENNSSFTITDGYTDYITNAVIGQTYTLELFAGESLELYAVGEQDDTCNSAVIYINSPEVCDIPEPCDMPEGLTVNASTHSAAASWNAGSSDKWEVFLNGNIVATVFQPSYNFTNLIPDTTYSIGVRAVCESETSGTAFKSITTPAIPPAAGACDWMIRAWGNMSGSSWELKDANGNILLAEYDRTGPFNDIQTITAEGPLTFIIDAEESSYGTVNYNVFRNGQKIEAGAVRRRVMVIDNLNCDGISTPDPDEPGCDIDLEAVVVFDGDCIEEYETYQVALTVTGGEPGDTYTIKDNEGTALSTTVVAGTAFIVPQGHYYGGQHYSFTAYKNSDTSCIATDAVQSPTVCTDDEDQESEACNWMVRVWSSNGLGTSWSLSDSNGNILIGAEDQPNTFNDIVSVTAPGPLLFTLNAVGNSHRSVTYNVFREGVKIEAGMARNEILILDPLYCTDVSRGSHGTDDTLAFDFSYYPNPVKDVLHIQSEKKVENVQVFNIGGFITSDVKSDIQNNEVDLTRLPAGMYIIKARLEGGQIETFKVWKK